MSPGALPAIANPRRAVSELLRVRKPGGLLYFYTYRHGWYDVVLSGFRKIAQGLGVRLCSRPIYAVCRLARLDPPGGHDDPGRALRPDSERVVGEHRRRVAAFVRH